MSKTALYAHIYNRHGSLSCNQCDFQTKSKQNLNHHIKSKHEGFLYECKECGNKFAFKQDMKLHIDAQHLGMIFNCSFPNCDFSSGYKSATHHHEKIVHLGKRHTCNECGKNYRNSSALKEHIKIVHLRKLYKCSICGAERSRSGLKTHLAAHKRKEKEKQEIEESLLHFPCPVCDYESVNQDEVSKHFRESHKIEPKACDE